MTSSIHLGSLDTKILYLELLQRFILHPSVSLSSSINLVAKVKIFFKLIMYVLSHDVSIYCMMELWTFLQVSILRSDIILLELVFPFFLVAGRFYINDVTALVILFFNLKCHHLLFGTSLHSYLLVGDYVCGLSYKSNAIVWLETFHKEYLYWQTLMHKYMIMQLL